MDGDPAGNTILFDLLLLLFFTLMNAYFAGAEMAVVSVNKNRIRSLAEEGNRAIRKRRSLKDCLTTRRSSYLRSRWRSHLPDSIPRRLRRPDFHRYLQSG